MCLVAVVLALVPLGAQPTFEVASIKRNKSGDPRAGLDISRGQLRATNMPLQPLLRQAFDVMDSQIVNGPGWLSVDRFDIIAKAPEGVTTVPELRLLIRSLLSDRFKLATHIERREMPIYALVKARSDGTLGATFRRAETDCQTNSGRIGSGGAPASATFDDWTDCGVMIGPAAINIGGQPMAEVTRILSTLVGRVVIDDTGVTGPVQFRVRFQPQGRGAAPPAAADGATDDRPNLFTALQEQTGLKLEARRGPVDVLVIDRVEHPTED